MDLRLMHAEMPHPLILVTGPTTTTAAAAGDEQGNAGTDQLGQEQLPGEELLVRFVVSQSSPLLFQDSPSAQRFFNFLNPAYPRITHAALKEAAMRCFLKEARSLQSALRDFKGRFSLTSSIWSDSFHEETEGMKFLQLNCHWIDDQWVKQNRVLDFVQVELKPSDVLVTIQLIALDWSLLKGRTLSINFDHRSNLDSAVKDLQSWLSPALDGRLFRSKCAHHIIDSCFKHGFSAIPTIVGKVRSAIYFIESESTELLGIMCKEKGLKYKRLLLDFPMWSNTTYDMLQSFVPYRPVIPEYLGLDFANKYDGVPLTEHEWNVLATLVSFFERFKSAFDTFCNVYIPTANLVIPILLTLSESFAQYRGDQLMGRICVCMEAKFAAYWTADNGIPMVYSLATILDPRYKLSGLFKLLDAYHANMNIPIRNTKKSIKALFYKAYDSYLQQYRLANRRDLIQTGCNVGTGTKSAVRLVHSSRNEGKGPKSYPEIDYYLNSDDVASCEDVEGLEMLDVLKWWKNNQGKYPVLAAMARDMLAPLASSKVPEDTFKFHGRGINERRRKFSYKMARMSVCYKDWIAAEERTQCLFVNENDDLSFEEEKEEEEPPVEEDHGEEDSGDDYCWRGGYEGDDDWFF